MTIHPPRRLIWIPIIHTQADLGTMAEAARQLHIQQLGQPKWERYCKTVNALWAEIRRYVDRLRLPWARVRLYQDGLPNCGREVEIVQNLATAGSLNHQLLIDLIKRGAVLIGTESPELLLEEYELASKILQALTASQTHEAQALQARSQAVLEKRDRYVAERIEQTLAVGETGLLFLGALHRLPPLPADIEVLRQGSPLDGKRGSTPTAPRPRRPAP